MRKILALVMAVAMICTMATGCKKKEEVKWEKEQNKTASDVVISKEIYTGAVGFMFYQMDMQYQMYGMSLADMLDQDMGDGKTIADTIMDEAEGIVKEFESVRVLAEKEGITLTEEELNEIKKTKEQQIESDGGKEGFLENLKSMGMTEAFFDYFMECEKLYQKCNDLYVGDGKYAKSADEIKKAVKTDYARVKHILISATEGAEDYEEKKAAAEKALARAKAGEDFDALVAELGEDPGMQSDPYGYVIDAQGYTIDGQGPMITEFTEGSFALSENGISELVSTSYGFHIIKRYPIEDAYLDENIEQIQSSYAANEFTEAVTKLLGSIKVKYEEGYRDINIKGLFASGTTATSGIEEGVAVPAEPALEAAE